MAERPQLPHYHQIKGFSFHVSRRPDVPEDIRAHDQEFHPGPVASLPKYGDARYGIWLPDPKNEDQRVGE